MKEFEQIESIIKSLLILIDAMKKGQLTYENMKDIELTVIEINKTLYHSEKVNFQKKYDLKQTDDQMAYIEELKQLIFIWRQSIKRRSEIQIDAEFWKIYEYFKYVNKQEIYQSVVRGFMNLPEAMRIEYLSLPHRYTFLQGKIDYIKKDFSLIRQHVELMSNKVEDYKWLYEHLADNRSRAILNGIIRYWFEFDLDRLHTLCETVFSDYYDLDIIESVQNAVIVDLGAFTGDSALSFAHTYGGGLS